MGRYTVLVDDNFHYMDEDERYTAGEFDTYTAAVSECERIVDDFLLDAWSEGMSAEKLHAQYLMFGEDPFVVPSDGDHRFSARDYARRRCEEIVADKNRARSARYP